MFCVPLADFTVQCYVYRQVKLVRAYARCVELSQLPIKVGFGKTDFPPKHLNQKNMSKLLQSCFFIF